MNCISRNAFLLVLILSGFALLFGAGSTPLWDPGETEFARIIQDMAEKREYLHPDILFAAQGAVACPLPYWLAAFSVLVFGVNAFAVRFPAVLMTILTVLLVYISAAKLFNERAGFWAGLILSSNVMVVSLGKAAGADAIFLFFLTAALLCFLQERYWLIYVFCGLAVLTKGMAAFFLAAGLILAYLFVRGELRQIRRMHPGTGLLIILAICLPWYVALSDRSGGFPSFLHGIKMLLLSAGAVRGMSESFAGTGDFSGWQYILLLLLGMYPWTGSFLKAMKDGICESRTEDLYKNLFLQLWWAEMLLVFLLSPGKTVTSLLPMFPAVSLLAGWNIDRMLREEKGHFIGWSAGSLLTSLGMAAACLTVAGRLPALGFGALVLGGLVLLSAAGIEAALLLYKDGVLGAWLHVASGLLWMVVVFVFIIPLIYPGAGR